MFCAMFDFLHEFLSVRLSTIYLTTHRLHDGCALQCQIVVANLWLYVGGV